jgi:hypothetical protein
LRLEIRPKVKTYFWPGKSAKNHWQSQWFFESKSNEKPMRPEMGFSLGSWASPAGFACLQTPNGKRQKVKTYFWPGKSAKNHWQSQ